MATLTWTANTSGVWSSAANWSPNAVPGVADIVLFNGSGTDLAFVSGSTVGSLILNDASALVTANGSLVTEASTISSGTLDVDSGGKVTLNNLSATGSIIVANGGSLALTGSLTTESLSHISLATGTVTLAGTLDNTGHTLTPFFNFTTASVIHGGVLTDYIAAGTLDGVTWQGPLTISSSATFANGFIVQSGSGTTPGSIAFSGKMTFLGSQTFDNVVVNSKVFGGEITAGDTLTLGSLAYFSLTGAALLTPSNSMLIDGTSAASTVVNQGSIVIQPDAGDGFGIGHTGGSSLITLAVGTFENAGLLLADSNAFEFAQISITSAHFVNQAAGLIETGSNAVDIGGAVVISAGTDFVNDGTIVADHGLITVNPAVQGSGTFLVNSGGTLVLGSSVAATERIQFQPGGTATLAVPALFAGTITGLTQGATLDLGVSASAVAYAGNKLTLQLGGGQTFDIAVLGSLSLADFIVNAGTGSTSITTDIAAPCFAAGSRIATPNGPVAVEDLRIGDRVMVDAECGTRPIMWIGHRRVACHSQPDPTLEWPIGIQAHAFGPAEPSRDLLLSPDHAIFAENVLIPARCLVNGETVRRVPVDEIVYYHIELDQHAIVYAEGLRVESYLDTDNRQRFENVAPMHHLLDHRPANFWANLSREALGCAPLVVIGPEVDAVRLHLRREAPMPQAA